ncbi:ABC transporter substrate-binding protein [Ruegeria sp. R13_0]|uniref:ABC transporter substrate-binding protein n=1 Tax=Ruegeria sp. R13_0 TaxID=2821099 RepID=UPI001ADB95BA|nr:ABC transporter substrate-binding protein [Ruegeria sp. R13_0]MBO9436958.1 ABC transporter substrate-binding protein [Ruegeria sp. R13_0]
MRSKLLTSAALVAMSGTVIAQEPPIKIGVLMGFTGPIESMAADMGSSAELALREISESGLFLGGRDIEVVFGDSTCTDAAAATSAAERLVTGDRVAAIVGAACSGATGAVATNVAIPNGIAIISPSATSPALSELNDNGLFFRTAPSDARQGEVLAEILIERGVTSIAATYTNNDYGAGLLDAFQTAYLNRGGEIVLAASHEDGRADYSAEVATLAASGADHLLVIGYADQGGRQIVQASLDTGAFNSFVFADGMYSTALLEALGSDLGQVIGSVPGGQDDRSVAFDQMALEAGIAGTGPYRAESYDAAAVLALAVHAAGTTDGQAISDAMMSIANEPGEPIAAGELERALRILSEGGEIDYVGATNVEFSTTGEASGSYQEFTVRDGAFVTQRIW